MKMKIRILAIVFGVFSWVCYVDGHGYMIQPPQRSSVWREPEFEDIAEKNHNDMELFCGGFQVSGVHN